MQRLLFALAIAAVGCGEAHCPEPRAAAAIAEPAPESPLPEVLAAADAPRRRAPNGRAQIALLALGNEAFVGRLELDPDAIVPEHRDPTEEYLVVLEGSGTIFIDGVEHAVETGATVFMPANALVTFQNGPAPLVAIQVFAGPESAAKYDAWDPI
jgi:quercetin dioxygenase-like cupin family protein